MMTVDRIIILARKHVADNPENEKTARAHLKDAVKFFDRGDLDNAKMAAVLSLGVSCGALSRPFGRANRWE